MTSSVDAQQIQPISRTYQYRKVMKPMLERKRRARINRCLDELKELMLSSLKADGENVSKLEKADILELTVSHLRQLQARRLYSDYPEEYPTTADSDRFRAGFTHCASEVSKCLASTVGVDVKLGTQLMTHLGHRLNEMEKIGSTFQKPSTFQNPLSVRTDAMTPPPSSPSSMSSCDSTVSSGYHMPLTPTSTTSVVSSSPQLLCPSSPSSLFVDAYNPLDMTIKSCASSPVWRPW